MDNIKWINSITKESPFYYLYLTWVNKNKSVKYAKTSCEVSVCTLIDKWFGNNVKWFLLDNDTFETMLQKYSIFVVTFGYGENGWESWEHCFAVKNNIVMQSYFDNYTLQSRIIDDKFICAMKDPNKEWKEITGISIKKDNEKLMPFYWLIK